MGPGPAALAHPPIHIRPGVEEFSFVLGEELCGFEVLVEVRQNLHITFFLDGPVT